MKRTSAILAALLILFTVFPAQAEEAAPATAPAVIELFTTQGCSSCPPVDALIKRLTEEDAELIALSCHVDYFDSEAWKDTMGQKFCNARHAAYFSSVPLPRIATPTAVINGKYEVYGENEDLTRSAIKMVRSLKETTSLTLEKNSEAIDVSLPDIPLENPAEVWLFGFKKAETVNITGGQNENAKIDYVNTITHLVKLMDWDGVHQKISYPLTDVPAEGYAILVQEQNTGPVIAAGMIRD